MTFGTSSRPVGRKFGRARAYQLDHENNHKGLPSDFVDGGLSLEVVRYELDEGVAQGVNGV
jgi:hypothetical protein